MADRLQITRLDGAIPRWQVRELKVYTSQLRYALRASEIQIQQAVMLKPGEQMFMDLALSEAQIVTLGCTPASTPGKEI